jgi:hypothetical protein
VGVEHKENLHEVAARFARINERLVVQGGEVNEATEAILAEADRDEATIHRKVDAIRTIIGRCDSEGAFYANEARAYGARSRAFKATAARWREWIIRSLDRAGLTSAGNLIPQRITDNGGRPSVEWVDIGKPIPKAFRKVVYQLDKAKVYEALDKGARLPKGIEVRRGRHLRDENVSREGHDDGNGVD